ncbi:MAG: 1-acyl-sn-glycerol-3-phosphate acyltransferase [Desulfobacterales bacterium]|nr:1-acyl-sn-glycerol-3-phosphate acyltransferase [Desulfobacterales bacterium]
MSDSETIKTRSVLARWIQPILKGRQYFACLLPGNIGPASTFILKLFYSGIKADQEQIDTIKQLPHNAIVIYASKFKSYFEYLFYYTHYKQNNIPFPEIGFYYRFILWQPVSRLIRIALNHLDFILTHRKLPNPFKSGYLADELEAGRTGLFALVDRKGFYRRFVKAGTDPLQYLIDMQEHIDRPIYIVPQLMFFGRKPFRSNPTLMDILFGPEAKPGRIRRMVTLFKNPGRIFIEVSKPINLQEFIEQHQFQEKTSAHQALVLRRDLLKQINRHRQSIIGPVLKSPMELKQGILTNDRLREFMQQYSKKRNIPLHVVHRKADSYVEEIATRFNMALIKIGEKMVGWFIKTMFEGVMINQDALARVKAMSQKGPLVLIPCHKSHIDYLILSYLLYNNNMPLPLIAAGKNLSFWPLGPFFRGGGAFFIRRTFRGAILYTKVFSEYIRNILAEGYNIEFFIEGGRSRTGKLILPKLGLLNILLTSFKEGASEDLILVPIYIGYDRVLEENAYLHEIEGGKKEPESFLQILQARKFLKKRYGKIYIKFHDPISLNSLSSENGGSIQEMTSKEQNIFCRNLGWRVLNAINRITVITPHSVAAAALLNCSRGSFTFDHITEHIQTYLSYLSSHEAMLADTLHMEPIATTQHVLNDYVQRKMLEPMSKSSGNEDLQATYQINEARRPLLEYYKNNCISFFIPAAFTSISILEKDAFQFSASDLHDGYTFLQDFFKYEFAYDIDKSSEHYVRKSIKAFIDDAILIPHPTLPDTYNLTSAGFRKLQLFARFLRTYFESYWIVLNYYMNTTKNSSKPKDRFKKIQSLGSRMYKNKQIQRKEAISKINFMNAESYFGTHGLKSSEDIEQIQFYKKTIQKYMNATPI